jgi:hypothetical protein
MYLRRTTIALALTLLAGMSAAAAPTPVPGGANQISALSATLGQTVFNGNLRITISDFRDASEADTVAIGPSADQKVMSFTALLRNGTHDEFFRGVEYTLADKDGITVPLGFNTMTPPNPHILQGGAARQRVVFAVSKDFVPVKLIVECAACANNSGFRAIRFTIPQH